jgi:hypothetical protein
MPIKYSLFLIFTAKKPYLMSITVLEEALPELENVRRKFPAGRRPTLAARGVRLSGCSGFWRTNDCERFSTLRYKSGIKQLKFM